MITWTEDDYNLNKICKDINKYISEYKMSRYHIYGLQNTNRPHVRIHAANKQLEELFKRSGYTLEVGKPVDADDNVIAIGIRFDVRQNIKITRQLIKTIVLAFENKLVTTNSSTLLLGRVPKGV